MIAVICVSFVTAIYSVESPSSQGLADYRNAWVASI